MEGSPGDGVRQDIQGTGGGGGSGGASGSGSKDGTGSHGGGGPGALPLLPLLVPKHYSTATIKKYIDEAQWTLLEQYLMTGVLGEDRTATSKYASLTFLIRRAELHKIIATKDEEKSHDYFKKYVQPLVKCTSDYINGPAMKIDIDEVANQIVTGKVPALSHLQRDIEDFFTLYHPNISIHLDKPERVRSQLWDFARRTYTETGDQGKKPRPNFRCLACGRDFSDGPTISVMKAHFLSGPLCGICPKVTTNIKKRLQEMYPQEDILQDAPVQIEIEEQQDSLLVKTLKEAQVRVKNVYDKTIITDNDRSEANRELRDAYNMLEQCVLMAQTGGISVISAPEAPPFHNSGGAGLTSPAGQSQFEDDSLAILDPVLFDEAYTYFQLGYLDGTETSHLQDQLPSTSHMHPGAQDIAPNPVGTHQASFDTRCQHGLLMWDCESCYLLP